MPIKGLTETPRMPRLGKIHLGIRATNSRGSEYPAKTDYFVCPESVQAVYGEQPKELDIMFPTEAEEYFTSVYFRAYSYSRGLVCQGDGERAKRMIDITQGNPESHSVEDNPLPSRDSKPENLQQVVVACAGTDCPDYQAKNCRQMMMLQFLLPNVPGLGVWQIDTTSWNSIRNILGGIALIKSMCGRVSMIPLKLQLVPLEVTPQATGRRDTVYVLNLSADFSALDLARNQALNIPITSAMLPQADDEIPDDLVLDNERTVNADTGEIVDSPSPEPESVPEPTPKGQGAQRQTEVIPPKQPAKPSTASLPALKSLNQLREAYNISVEQIAGWVTENYDGKTVRELTDEQIDFVKVTIQNGGTFVADLKPSDPEPEPEPDLEAEPTEQEAMELP